MSKIEENLIKEIIAYNPIGLIPEDEIDTINYELSNELRKRAEFGKAKYGVTMEREDLTTKQWIQHALEEGMDFSVYLEKLREEKPSYLISTILQDSIKLLKQVKSYQLNNQDE